MARPQRNLGSGSKQRGQEPGKPNNQLIALVALAVGVVVATVVVTTVIMNKGPESQTGAGSNNAGGGSGGSATGTNPALGADPFANVARAGADIWGDDVGSFDEKIGDDRFTVAFPKPFLGGMKTKSVSDGRCINFPGPEKSHLVWVVGAMKGLVTTADMIREANLNPNDRTGTRAIAQRLGPVVASGEAFTFQVDPEPLEGICLRAGFGQDREVIGLAVAPKNNAKLRAAVDAMLGSLRTDKIQGSLASGGTTYLPRR